MTSKLASYEYDSLGRLIRVSFPDGAMASYAYDAAGNRTTVVEVPALSMPGAALTVSGFAKKNTGDFLNSAMLVKLSNGEIVGWGDNTNGVLANGIAAATSQPPQKILFDPNSPLPPFNATIVDWTFTNANLYVVFSNGWVYAAGQNAYGQLGTGEATSVVRPYLKRIEYFVTNGKSITKVWASGGRYTTDGGGCVFFLTSTGALYACGNNTTGALGIGNTTNQSSPVLCGGLPTSILDVQISCVNTSFSTYVLATDNRIYVTGYNAQGQLGVGSTTNQTSFATAMLSTGGAPNFKSLSVNGGYNSGGAAGGGNALAIDNNGDVWTTGYNGHGELGQGNTTNLNKFTKISTLSNIVTAELGGGVFGMGYALNAAGSFYTWGYNGQNNLFKNNTTTPQSTPAVASFVPGMVAKVIFPKGNSSVSTAQMFVLTTSGSLVYSGADNGQLPIDNLVNPGAYSYIALPRNIIDGRENIVDLFPNGRNNVQRLFLLTDLGNLYACGSNEDAVATAGLTSNITPASVSCFKLNLAQIDN